MRLYHLLLVGATAVALAGCLGGPSDPNPASGTAVLTASPGLATGTPETETTQQGVGVATAVAPTVAATTDSAATATMAVPSPSATPAESSPTPSPLPVPSATPEPLNPLTVVVDAGHAVGPFEKARLLNGAVGGYAALANLNWLPGFYDALKQIDMQMVRLDHVTDDAFYSVVWRAGDGTLRYDFSRLDRVVVTMLQQGIEPLMALSYRPAALAPGGDDETVPPSDLDAWAAVVRTFVEHYRNLGYSGLSWEVWNEPDQAFFFKGDAHQYVELYVATAQAIKQADPTARVGGAADSSVESPGGKLRPLLEYLGTHPEVPLDFVSYHNYSDPDGDGQPPFVLDWDADVIAEMVAEVGLTPRDIYVTEYNLTPKLDTGAGAATDTHVGAAALAVKLFAALRYPEIRRVFFFSPMEGYQPAKIFSGDLGLLTVNGHRKATYNLFQMVATLGDTRLNAEVTGDHVEDFASYALATGDSGSGAVGVLVWNYWDRARTVDLTVTGLPSTGGGQPLVVTRMLIDAEHGDYFSDYAAGLRGYSVGPTEALVPVESSRASAGEPFVQRFAMAPYSVSLIMLAPADAAPVVAVPAPGPRNWAAGAPVAVDSTLEVAGWRGQGLVDEVAHSLPAAYGWSSALVATADVQAWAEIDLGVPRTLDTVTLAPRDDQGYEGAGFPLDFAIQGSVDHETWRDLVVATGYDPGEPSRDLQVFSFPAGDYRYVRLVATRLGAVDDGVYALQLAEMGVFGPAP